jgi:hypothetical protein
LLCIKLHQKRENPVRQLLRQLVARSKLSPDLPLNGAKTHSLVPGVPFVELREVMPFLRYREKGCANLQTGGSLGHGQALSGEFPVRWIIRHRLSSMLGNRAEANSFPELVRNVNFLAWPQRQTNYSGRAHSPDLGCFGE